MFNFRKNNKKRDLVVLFTLFIFACFITYYFKVGIMLSGIVYFLLPAVYLSVVEKKNLLKGVIITFMTSFPVILITCSLFEYNKVWDYGNKLHLLLPMMVKGHVPFDIIIWGMSWLMYLYLFYEHFIDKKKAKIVNFKKLAIVSFVIYLILILILVAFQHFPGVLLIPYPYFTFCTAIFILCLPLYYTNFKVFKHSLLVIPFFFMVHAGQEYTSLLSGHWTFPGQYLYMLPFFGFYIPVEELLFWLVFGSGFTCFIYEELFDNDKN